MQLCLLPTLEFKCFKRALPLLLAGLASACGDGTATSEPAVGAAATVFVDAVPTVSVDAEQAGFVNAAQAATVIPSQVAVDQSTDLVAEQAPDNAAEVQSQPAFAEVIVEPVTAVEPVSNIVVSSDWPVNANGDLPLAGVFYGNPIVGTRTTNAAISVESSRRFRSQRSGRITGLRFHNRVLAQNDIDKKCDAQGSSSTWCKCKNAGLDARSCGYTIGSSYSVGNGGLIVVEIRPDDGNGLPSDVVLGKSSSYVPLEEYEKTGSHYVNVEFSDSVDLTIGGLYHLVLTNLNPPGSCLLSGLSVSEAAACPRDKGAISLNGVYDISVPTTTGRWGPMRGDSGSGNLYRSQTDNSWKEFDKGLAFYELYYDDGVAVGESYHALDATAAGEREIGGSTIARQRFVVEDTTREVDGVWLNFGHSSGSDGSALSVTLKDSSDQVLASGSIAASGHCVAEKSATCRDWGYTSFSSSASLIEGNEYTLEISASAGSKLRLSTYQSLLPQGFKDRNNWTNALAEYSNNNGSSWNEWTSYKGEVRDLGLLFTILGMPRKLP